ncbi:hypothetical protein ACHAWU_002940 [Discostella pseudostelligera]|uniref:Transmembrane protein n=1 Tax=Discostella pseudostelligera TaxID=259834 RepID=A0ABD3M4X9_9STRA
MDVAAGSIGPIGDHDQDGACQSQPQHVDDGMTTTAAAVDAMGLIPSNGSRRRRHHHSSRGIPFVKATMTTAVLLLVGSSVVVFQLAPSTSTTFSKIASSSSVITTTYHPHQLQDESSPSASVTNLSTTVQQSLSNAIQHIQRLGRREHTDLDEATFKHSVAASSSPVSFTAESAELAWENYLENAILHPLRQRHRNLRRSEGEKSLRKIVKAGNDEKKNNRRTTVKVEEDHPLGGEETHHWFYNASTLSWITLLLNSSFTAPLLTFCGILFLIASLVVGSRLAFDYSNSSSNGVRGSRIILDEDEAEIVEFYEKELSLQTIPFLQDEEDDDVHEPTAGTSRVVAEEEEDREPHLHQNSPTRCNTLHHRSASDSSLMRHHHHRSGSEIRQSQGDLYYSMVLQTLNYDEDVNIGGGDEDNEILHLSEVDDHEEKKEDEDCRGPMIMENVSSLTEDGLADSNDDEDDDDLASFKSAKSEEEEVSQEQECDDHHHHDLTQGPPSSHSSMSSLTSDGYDIEAACGSRRVREDASTKHNSGSHDDDAMFDNSHPLSSPSYALSPTAISRRLSQASRRLALTAATDSDQDDVHPTASAPTPPRSNLHRDRRRHDDLVTNNTNIEDTKQLSRRVSFCNEVKVRRIPYWTQSAKQQCHELSSESYLYFMLFAVAIVIVIFSLMPANPSLSPIHSMDRVDIFQRADTILSSQWDVEL